jgi:hypothetical protein
MPGVNAFVAKFQPDGRTLVYCTYLGGSGNDQALGLAVDSSGSAFVTGWTDSINFPVVGPLQPNLAGLRNAFISKLSPTGNTLWFSTYFGGNMADSGNAIALDTAANVYIAGETTSSSGFRTANAFQPHTAGGRDAFVLKMNNAGSSLLYATYIGGSREDRARAIAINSAGEAHVTGDTTSSDFPTSNAFQRSSGGNQDAFVFKLNASGTGLIFGTYVGGSGGTTASPESGSGIAVDAIGNAYITGSTVSANFPLVNASATFNGSIELFLCKIDGAGVVQYSSYTGGLSADFANALALSSTGTVYIAGYTGSPDLPGASPGQSSHHGLYDAFVMQFRHDGTVVESMYVGGVNIDSANAIAVHADDQLYVVGQTASDDFPVTNAFQTTSRGQVDSFLVRLAMPHLDGLYFVPITPCRVIDTRLAPGTFGGPALPMGVVRDVPIPAGACSVPADARAYALNVTVVPRGTLGYLTVWPAGQSLPNVSTLNSIDGRVKANAAIVPAGVSGSISVFATNTTDFLIDVNGYFVPAGTPHALAFYPVAPCRVIDTRIGTGPLAGPGLTAWQTRQVPLQSSSCGLPAHVAAYSLNFTAIPKHSQLWYLSAWPGGTTMPVVSTLNAPTGSVTANAAIIPAGIDGSISLYASNNTDVVIDINGYFATPGLQGLRFYGSTPCRIADTRLPGPLSGTLVNGQRDFLIAGGECGVPSSAAAYALNATVVPQGSLGFLTLWPSASAMPVVSTLNAIDGSLTSNLAVVPTSNGAVSAFASGGTDLIFDVMGYFGP